MTREDEAGAVPAREREAGGQAPHEDDGRVRPPTPEEAPELLGERSDYPVPFGDES